MAHAAVEVQVGKTGDQAAAPGINLGATGLGGNFAVLNAQVAGRKALMGIKYLGAGYPHTATPSLRISLSASSSPTRVTSAWS